MNKLAEKVVNLEDVVKLTKSLLNVSFPTDAQTLKQAYKRACFLNHPDRGGDESIFKQIQDLYQNIMNFVARGSLQLDVPGDELRELRTTDGIALGSLGLGLGPTKNGKDCTFCNGKGYTPIEYPVFQNCDYCFGNGYSDRFICTRCNGSGRYTNRSGREGDCFRCKGSGQFRTRREVICRKCNGLGRAMNRIYSKTEFTVCSTCRGTGETEVWNPVLPKGRL